MDSGGRRNFASYAKRSFALSVFVCVRACVCVSYAERSGGTIDNTPQQ